MQSVFSLAAAALLLFGGQTTTHIISPVPHNMHKIAVAETPKETHSSTAPASPTPTEEEAPAQKSTPTQTPTLSPSPLIASASSALSTSNTSADTLFSMVNDHRKAIGLPVFLKEDRVCYLANSRAPEIANEMVQGILHSGMYGRGLPYWNTENAAAMGSVEADYNWWMSDYIHKKAIESTAVYSCTSCSGVYCVEEFTSFQPK